MRVNKRLGITIVLSDDRAFVSVSHFSFISLVNQAKVIAPIAYLGNDRARDAGGQIPPSRNCFFRSSVL